MTDYEEYNDRKFTPIRQQKSLKRILIRDKDNTNNNAEEAVIATALGKTYIACKKDKNEEMEYIECSIAGAISSPHTDTTILAIGDRVDFIRSNKFSSDNGIETGLIVKVHQRESFLSRLAPGRIPSEQVIAANIDNILIFMSYDLPPYNKRLIDRIIVASELGIAKPIICINKIDLADDEDFLEDFKVYNELGLEVYFFSLTENIGLDKILNIIRSGVNVLIGPSGTGKSTLINKIFGEHKQTIQDISEKTGKGKHTTSSSKMFYLNENSALIDTPGIREFGLWGLDKEELQLYFHDFDIYFPNCKYQLCTHIHEPECAVIPAVERSEIDFDRYESYINIYYTMK